MKELVRVISDGKRKCFTECDNVWQRVSFLDLKKQMNKKIFSNEIIKEGFIVYMSKEEFDRYKKKESVKETERALGYNDSILEQ